MQAYCWSGRPALWSVVPMTEMSIDVGLPVPESIPPMSPVGHSARSSAPSPASQSTVRPGAGNEVSSPGAKVRVTSSAY